MTPNWRFTSDAAVNHTRRATLASAVCRADTALTRLFGLLLVPPRQFGQGRGLWIVPSHGVHCLGMRYAIDAIYLDRGLRVIHLEPELRPGRWGAVRRESASVLELPAGTIAASGTAIGDQIAIQF